MLNDKVSKMKETAIVVGTGVAATQFVGGDGATSVSISTLIRAAVVVDAATSSARPTK